ncbi:uncharacterized protein LOC126293427 isoform X2 [Schistocerca gregaria]|uniref:uncharacterized protein LOC126293427 isoform X2 n=1 Tax=Schistocerca gregaria TaxID=7010 RepID=UPI00211F0F36|nr:uncharacterized protein LOC126293427 isoform X2 [Schistocerca gregaria]
MEQVLTEDGKVRTMRKTSRRRGPGRRRNFVQENIAFLKELQTTLQERKTNAKASPRARKQRAQTGKHSARKGKNSPKSEPYVTDDNVGNIDIKLTTEEQLLLKGYGSLATQSNTDLLSNLSSTDHEPDIVETTVEDGTGVDRTSKNSEETKSHISLERQDAVRGIHLSKETTSVRQGSAACPSGEDLTDNSLPHTFSVTKQPSIKMTAKAMAARKKVLAPSTPDPLKAPPSYKRGVVPRYLRSQKKEQQKGDEELFDSQQGYIPLPNDTRKEVLTLLRKSFADLAHQLNMLPLRPPNLEIRERRMDIEKQLDKLEEAIQVFSQSEVSVKLAFHKRSAKSV